MELQKTLVNGAKLLDVEGGVVDAARRCAGPLLVIGQIPERSEEVAVAQGASVEGLCREQFAVERGEGENGGEFVVLKQVEECAQAQPQVGVIRPRGLDVEHTAQAGDAVVVAIDGIGADKAPVFGHKQEQETVNQPEELAVELR